MIKMFGWETRISEDIAEKRRIELAYVWKTKVYQLTNEIFGQFLPLVHLIVTYAIYTLAMKRELTASVIFSSLGLFDVLRTEIYVGRVIKRTWSPSDLIACQMFSQLLPSCIQAKVSFDRLQDFLHNTELLDAFTGEEGTSPHVDSAASHKDDIGISSSVFSWSAERSSLSGTQTPSKGRFRLRVDEDLIFEKGRINLIAEPTGSGKTSVLMALLGEMHYLPNGPGSWYNLPRAGGVAYAAQESWVQNETIRENILFGAPYDQVRYQKGEHWSVDSCTTI
jgi:ABC-type multidrug transport system fused ATPase/permease subunit